MCLKRKVLCFHFKKELTKPQAFLSGTSSNAGLFGSLPGPAALTQNSGQASMG